MNLGMDLIFLLKPFLSELIVNLSVSGGTYMSSSSILNNNNHDNVKVRFLVNMQPEINLT